MASPQVENGYTMIADELLEVIIRYHCLKSTLCFQNNNAMPAPRRGNLETNS
jgi:hypothetical protein